MAIYRIADFTCAGFWCMSSHADKPAKWTRNTWHEFLEHCSGHGIRFTFTQSTLSWKARVNHYVMWEVGAPRTSFFVAALVTISALARFFVSSDPKFKEMYYGNFSRHLE